MSIILYSPLLHQEPDHAEVNWSIDIYRSLRRHLVNGCLLRMDAVGASEVIAEVASWYYVLQSAILGLFGVGLVLLGYATPLVLGLTAGFVCSGLFFAVRYSRDRRTHPPSEEDAR